MLLQMWKYYIYNFLEGVANIIALKQPEVKFFHKHGTMLFFPLTAKTRYTLSLDESERLPCVPPLHPHIRNRA